MRCPYCATDNPDNAAFCISCGKPLPGGICPTCGQEIPGAGPSFFDQFKKFVKIAVIILILAKLAEFFVFGSGATWLTNQPVSTTTEEKTVTKKTLIEEKKALPPYEVLAEKQFSIGEHQTFEAQILLETELTNEIITEVLAHYLNRQAVAHPEQMIVANAVTKQIDDDTTLETSEHYLGRFIYLNKEKWPEETAVEEFEDLGSNIYVKWPHPLDAVTE